MVVTQNIVTSLFNSHLFDFTAGWTYVFGVGVAGGMVLRQRSGAPAKGRYESGSVTLPERSPLPAHDSFAPPDTAPAADRGA